MLKRLRKLRVLLPASAALLAIACTTTPVPSSSAKPVPPSRIHAPEFTKAEPGFGFVVVTRDTGLQVESCAAGLYVDGTLVAELEAGEQMRLFVQAGEHLVGVTVKGGVCVTGSDQISIGVSEDKPVLLRLAAKFGDSIKFKRSAF
jgi:hypothetical protein